MAYLILNDYKRIIQSTELSAITSNTDSIRQLVEQSTQTEINESLVQQFDTAAEFTNTSIYSPAVIYKAANRVYLDAASYSPTSLYALSSLTLQAGQVYINTTAIVVVEVFTPAHWAILGNQYDIFFVSYPFPLFSQDAIYLQGDKVFWRDNTYVSTSNTPIRGQQHILQANSIQAVYQGNVLPDDRNLGRTYWGTPTPYALPAGSLPTDSTKWTMGDNRNQHMMEIFMDMVVYKLCKRIAPNNVPEARHNAWIKAVKDITAFADGSKNAQIQPLQPNTGSRVQYGGKPPRNYNW